MFDLATSLIVGIGNPYRRDDGVGPWVSQRLAARGFHTLLHAGDGAGLIDVFTDAGSVILVDATKSGAPAGTTIKIDAHIHPLSAEMFHYSTHRFGLAEAVETARALAILPANLLVYGIEGANFDAGKGLSEPVAKAAHALVQDHFANQLGF